MIEKTYFVDTSFWTAKLSHNDNYHQKAERLGREIGKSKLVTSEAILTELLNAFSGKGTYYRKAAAKLVDSLKAHKLVVVRENDTELFNAALNKYNQYSDKQWGLTDCSSFVIMEQENITEALTTDRDFEQAGFIALMRA